jgi:hypothetical protein
MIWGTPIDHPRLWCHVCRVEVCACSVCRKPFEMCEAVICPTSDSSAGHVHPLCSHMQRRAGIR